MTRSSERSIVFSAEEVRATLAGRKTQVRRLVDRNDVVRGPSRGMDLGPGESAWWIGRGKYSISGTKPPTEYIKRCRYGAPGTGLWVREGWAAVSPHEDSAPLEECRIEYRADVPVDHLPGDWHEQPDDPDALRWRSSMHMPRAAARILLEVTGVRIERLHKITEADAIAEGIESAVPVVGEHPTWCDYSMNTRDSCEWYGSPLDSYKSYWAMQNPKTTWSENPLVWVVSFKKLAPATRIFVPESTTVH